MAIFGEYNLPQHTTLLPGKTQYIAAWKAIPHSEYGARILELRVPLYTSVTLSNLLHLTVPQFPHL